MAWSSWFRRGAFASDDGNVFGTATYRDPETQRLLFRPHEPEMAIAPGHGPLPDAGAIEIAEARFTLVDSDEIDRLDWSRIRSE